MRELSAVVFSRIMLQGEWQTHSDLPWACLIFYLEKFIFNSHVVFEIDYNAVIPVLHQRVPGSCLTILQYDLHL